MASKVNVFDGRSSFISSWFRDTEEVELKKIHNSKSYFQGVIFSMTAGKILGCKKQLVWATCKHTPLPSSTHRDLMLSLGKLNLLRQKLNRNLQSIATKYLRIRAAKFDRNEQCLLKNYCYEAHEVCE